MGKTEDVREKQEGTCSVNPSVNPSLRNGPMDDAVSKERRDKADAKQRRETIPSKGEKNPAISIHRNVRASKNRCLLTFILSSN